MEFYDCNGKVPIILIKRDELKLEGHMSMLKAHHKTRPKNLLGTPDRGKCVALSSGSQKVKDIYHCDGWYLGCASRTNSHGTQDCLSLGLQLGSPAANGSIEYQLLFYLPRPAFCFLPHG